MQAIELTIPELSFITDLTTSYKNRRVAALKKTTRKSHSAELETATLDTLISKLETLHSQALKTAPQATSSNLPHPIVTHADVELPVITPVAESLG